MAPLEPLPGFRGAAGARAGGALARIAFLAALTLALAPQAARAEPPKEGSPECGIPAFVDEGDDGLRVAYGDGLRRGLEEANLPRVCLEKPERDDAEGWAKVAARVSEKAPPVVFAFGRKSIARVAAAPFRRGEGRIPCVYVDSAVTVAGSPAPADPTLPVPCAVVRAHVSVEAWGKVVRALLPGRPQPTVLLPWTAETPEAKAWREAAGAAAGLDLVTRREGVRSVDAFLDVTPALGETVEPFDATLREARALRIPLLSGDRGRFRAGAAVVLVPDHALLGRVAAEAGRRLANGEGAESPLRLGIRAARTWVDLDAADAEGLKPPLSFLAAADFLQVGPAAGGAR